MWDLIKVNNTNKDDNTICRGRLSIQIDYNSVKYKNIKSLRKVKIIKNYLKFNNINNKKNLEKRAKFKSSIIWPK